MNLHFRCHRLLHHFHCPFCFRCCFRQLPDCLRTNFSHGYCFRILLLRHCPRADFRKPDSPISLLHFRHYLLYLRGCCLLMLRFRMLRPRGCCLLTLRFRGYCLLTPLHLYRVLRLKKLFRFRRWLYFPLLLLDRYRCPLTFLSPRRCFRRKIYFRFRSRRKNCSFLKNRLRSLLSPNLLP